MSKALITTFPFADKDPLPLHLLHEAGIDFLINPIGRKLKEDELAEIICDFDVLIAGTEPITEKVMANGKNLKLISRVGIGLDSVDLLAAEKRGIQVSYTPDAPAPAVAELTIGMMLTLLRHVHVVNSQMHQGLWHRYFGRRVSEITIGIIGAGRIGSGVVERLSSFNPSKILVNDINPRVEFSSMSWVQSATKDEIYKKADLISLHLPLTAQTRNMIRYDDLREMKEDAIIINTSRGGIINEHSLARALNEGHLAGAAIDVFEQEPYQGELRDIERCLLTSHMGSMSVDCRTRMEVEATEEAVRFLSGEPLVSPVPEEEYEVQRSVL
ncbi:phosphoglycerate dehydrogenase [Alphaproteobacteria bacterium]|nr:phosphoglycerate dehydrogenase [Alphaproteobacteria bacterium]